METSMPDDTDGESYTVDEFCEVEKIGHTTFYQELNSGRLKAKKIGNRTVILPAERRRWRANLPDYEPKDGANARDAAVG